MACKFNESLIMIKIVLEEILDFIPSILPTLIGTCLGFIFSLMLFFLTKAYLERREKKLLKRSLVKELELNVSFLEKILAIFLQLHNDLESGVLGDKLIKGEKFIQPIDSSFRRFFIETYLQKGYFYDELKTIDIENLEEILYVMKDDRQVIIYQTINNLSCGKIDPTRYGTFEEIINEEVEKISGYKEILINIRNKIIV